MVVAVVVVHLQRVVVAVVVREQPEQGGEGRHWQLGHWLGCLERLEALLQ